MKYLSAGNPKWANAEHSAIELHVDFPGLGVVPYGATPVGEGNSPELFSRAVAGDFGPVAEYTKSQDLVNAEALAALRAADGASVRSLREFILEKFPGDAKLHATLVECEVKAQEARKNIK
jgi:hypothetical protein